MEQLKERNVTVRQNKNGTASVAFSRQIRGDVHKIGFNQIKGDTLEEKLKSVRAISVYLGRMYEMAKSRISMMDIITSRKHISVVGTPNRNARVIIYMPRSTVSWSIRKHGLQRTLDIAVSTLLTRLQINDPANRVILGKVLRDRALNEYNERIYNAKKSGNVRCRDIRRSLSELNKKFKADKYMLPKNIQAHEQSLGISCYLTVGYRFIFVRKEVDGKLKWSGVFCKCINVDSISCDNEGQGHFTALMNELLIACRVMKYDCVRINNVVNPHLADSLRRNNIFSEQPDHVDENDNPVYSEYMSSFVRLREGIDILNFGSNDTQSLRGK